MRLDENTPAKQSIKEFLKVERNRRGRPSATWMSIIKKDLEGIGINIDYTKPEDAYNKLINITHDRKSYNDKIKQLMQ